MSRLVHVLNGPNLDLLGERQAHIYGHETLADMERGCRTMGDALKLGLRFHQSSREYEIIDWTHEARRTAGGIAGFRTQGYQLTLRSAARLIDEKTA